MLIKCTLPVLVLSCALAGNNAIAQQCIDPASDSDGDGYGYENGRSCIVAGSTNRTTAGACIDNDGDGFGWNGVDTCLINPSVTTETDTPVAAAPVTTAGACIDSDGDGYGWDGFETCLISSEPVVQPPAVEPPTPAAVIEPLPVVTPVVVTPPTAPAPVVTPQAASPAVTATPSYNPPACSVTLSSGANLYNAVANNTGRICLRPGSYSLPDNLTMRSNQSLSALNASNPPVINTSANRSITTTGRSNVTLDNVIIEGNGTGAREFAILVGSGSRNILLHNVTIRNTFGIGIGITESNTVNIHGGTISNIGLDTRLRQAVWTAFSSRDITIDGLTVRGRANDQAGGDHAITCIDSVNGFTVTNTRSEFAGSGAVAINNCSNIVVTNNQLHNGREHAVDIVNGSINALVSGNNITNFDRSAMVFDDHDWTRAGGGTNPTEITVINNQMSDNNRINLARCKGIAVDSQMVINPTPQQRQSDWVDIASNNRVDSDSALFCQHIN